MFFKILKWSALGVLALVLVSVVGLLIVGVPKPPAITAENVGRLPLGYVTANLEAIRVGMDSKSFSDWLPGEAGMLVWSSHRIVDSRLHQVASPGAEPEFLADLDRRAAVYTTRGRDDAVVRWDEAGTEAYQLYRWMPGGGAPVRLTNGTERASFGDFEPDGERIVFSTTRRNGTDYDLYVVDPREPGSEEMVLETEGTWGVWEWSPVDDRLLLNRFLSNFENELYVFDLETRDLRLVSDTTGDPVRYGSAQWAPDGRALYYTSDRDAEFRRLRRLDLETGEETTLADLPWDITSVQQPADGSFLILRANEDARPVYYRYEVVSATLEPLDFGLGGHVYWAALHPDEPRLAVTQGDPTGRNRVYVYDLASGAAELWAGDPPPSEDLPEARIIHYPTFDSVAGAPREIPAIVYPALGESPHAVIVDIHGGPESQATVSPGSYLPIQRKGITVIRPNVRGSTGYGKTYQSLDNGFLREDAVRDIGALLDWIDGQPELDEERVLVMGGSYGGYMTLASLVHFGERIRCGVDVVGISSFVTFLENTADYRRDLRRPEYGDERDPEMRAFLDSISPLHNAERIVSPLMVVQGANDPRVPVTEAEQMVERVREVGTPVRYIVAANEGHGFRNPWNAIYEAIASLQFADECFGIEGPTL